MQNQRKPIGTIIIAIINVGVFFFLSFGGMTENGLYMLEHGAMYAPNFLTYKEYYRIFSCMFLHFGFEHLMNNMVTLVVVGKHLEPIVGTAKFLVIYILSGMGGTGLSLLIEWYTQDFAISAGASGAIFGLTGALLGLTILNGGYIAGISKRGMLIVIAISLYNGFASSGVNNLAHIGGLLAGFLLSILLCRKGNAKRCSHTDF